MSDPRRVEGERVFCHQCSHEWDRPHGGLTCPSCEGEFVEILSPSENRSPSRSREPRPASEPPSPPLDTHPFHNHNPWADAPDPDEGDISSFEFNTLGGGRGTFTFTSRTYRSGGNGMPPALFPFSPFAMGGQQPRGFGRPDGQGGIFPRDTRGQPGPADMQDLFSMIFQTMQHGGVMGNRPVAGFGTATFGGGPRGPNDPVRGPSPFDLLGAILNPSGRQGDAVWSQEAFDRILEQLAEQNQVSTAPGPASEEALKSLPTRKVTEDMMGNDGKAECSICMDNVELGDDVTELPCKHWFHGECVTVWLKSHDTCPHCRKPITKPEDQQPQSSRRRSSRQSPAVPYPFGGDGASDRNYRVPDSPGPVREARNHYYQNQNRSYHNDNRSAYSEAREQPYFPGQYPSQQMPPRPRRHSSSQSGRHSSSRQNSDRGNSGSGAGGGGITGWVRNHMPGMGG